MIAAAAAAKSPQLCPTLCDPMNCSPPSSSLHGILQARILEWVAIPFSRGSSWHRDQTQVSSIAGRFFTVWATREAPFLLVPPITYQRAWGSSTRHVMLGRASSLQTCCSLGLECASSLLWDASSNPRDSLDLLRVPATLPKLEGSVLPIRLWALYT